MTDKEQLNNKYYKMESKNLECKKFITSFFELKTYYDEECYILGSSDFVIDFFRLHPPDLYYYPNYSTKFLINFAELPDDFSGTIYIHINDVHKGVNFDEEWENDKMFQLSLVYDCTDIIKFMHVLERNFTTFTKFILDIKEFYNE